MIEFKKIANGRFNVLLNNIPTEYQIVNGCLGQSGNGKNMYGIANNKSNKTIWVGSLQNCKKSLIHTLEK